MLEELTSDSDPKTNLNYLDFWWFSVALLASQNKGIQVMTDSNVLPEKLPPVFLVRSHADIPFGRDDPGKLS